jgi:putative ABC transport system permease protein
MEEERRFHLEMEAERLMREEGLDAAEARRQAHVVFGGEDSWRETMREGRGMAWLSGLRLDLKLGFRMLVKYPVLTGAAVLALAVAVALAVSWFEFQGNMTPGFDFPGADRMVVVQNRDLASADVERRSLHDYETWRDEVSSIEDLSAAATTRYNLTTDGGVFAAVVGARVTPATFRLIGADPMLGRTLTASDYAPGAPPVIVLGYDAWQRLLGGDRGVVGREVQLGAAHATIVGVMPEGFGFPMNHELWAPLRENALDHERRRGPALSLFGRLAPGATVETAQAELTVLGERATAAYPETHEHLRPDVRPLSSVANDMARIALLMNIPFLLFMIVVSANVATLLFARTATRESEIAMRIALGASRRRVVLQLIAEAFVITALGAALGLAAAQWGYGRAMALFWEVQQMRPPFWFSPDMSLAGVFYVFVLALLAATVVGAIPALRATRKQLRDLIGQPGGTGMKFGAVATAVIIVQVALSVAFIPVAIMRAQELMTDVTESTFPADAFLTGRVTVPDYDGAANDAERLEDVHRRLTVEPGVAAIARASWMPGFNHALAVIEVEDAQSDIGRVRVLGVDTDFFDLMEMRIVAGRSFTEGDATSSHAVAIVDEEWAQGAFGGRNAVGRRLRLPAGADEGEWREIVGVVAGTARATGPGSSVSIFEPLRPADHGSVLFYLRTEVQPAALAPQVHALVSAVDPDLVISDLMPLDDAWRPVQRSAAFLTAALLVVAFIIVLFALMGVYALTSFSVAQRTREIGIRAALGANPRRILVSIFSRALTQIGLGIVAGMLLVSLTIARSPEGIRLVLTVAIAMAVVGLIGCTLPARRALRIQPTDALRSE